MVETISGHDNAGLGIISPKKGELIVKIQKWIGQERGHIEPEKSPETCTEKIK